MTQESVGSKVFQRSCLSRQGQSLTRCNERSVCGRIPDRELAGRRMVAACRCVCRSAQEARPLVQGLGELCSVAAGTVLRASCRMPYRPVALSISPWRGFHRSVSDHGRKIWATARAPDHLLHDGPDPIVTASNYGGPKRPQWDYNLKAHPECELGGDKFWRSRSPTPTTHASMGLRRRSTPVGMTIVRRQTPSAVISPSFG